MAVQDTVKDKMKKKGWGQVVLAEKSSVAQSTISEWLTGKHDIKWQPLKRILIALEIKTVKIADA